MAETQQPTKVLVTNISKEATPSNISDFFSFCGKIKNLSLSEKEENKEAIIEFETPNATSTALLLNNAIIISQPITVTTHTLSESSQERENQIPQDEITQREFQLPDSQRTKSSVISTLIGQGYHLAHDALQKAYEIDQNYSISTRVNSGYEQLKGKANEFDKNWGISETVSKRFHQVDNDYHVTEKVNALRSSTSEKVKQIDSDYKVSEKTNQGVESLKQGFWSGLERVKQDITRLQRDYPAFAEVTQKVSNVVEECKTAIHEQNQIYFPSKPQQQQQQEEEEPLVENKNEETPAPEEKLVDTASTEQPVEE